MRLPGATWCDVTRDGRVVAIGTPIDARQITVGDVVRVPLATAPEDLLYLRADTSAAGVVALVAQGSSGQGWLYVAGLWGTLGPTQGQNCVEIVGDGTGWLVAMQVAPDRYELLTLDAAGGIVSRVGHAMPWTSQGFLDAADPRLTFTDSGRVIGGVMLPQACGPYLVGQDPQAERMLLADAAGAPLRVLDASGPVWEPRAAYLDGLIVACSRSDRGGAIVVRGVLEAFAQWAPIQPSPAPTPDPPTPPPAPPPPETQTMWTSQHQSVLEQFVAKFSLPPYKDEDAARGWTLKLAQQFAFSFPSEGWGTKRADPNRPPSTDVICTRSPFIGYDVIVNQGKADQSVAWKPSAIDLAGQVFIAVEPVDWLAGTTLPGPTPPFQPPPITTTCRALTADEVRGIVKSELLVIETVAGAVTAAMREQLAALSAQLEAMAKRQEELTDLLSSRIVRYGEATRTVTVSGRVSFTGTTTLQGKVGAVEVQS